MITDSPHAVTLIGVAPSGSPRKSTVTCIHRRPKRSVCVSLSSVVSVSLCTKPFSSVIVTEGSRARQWCRRAGSNERRIVASSRVNGTSAGLAIRASPADTQRVTQIKRAITSILLAASYVCRHTRIWVSRWQNSRARAGWVGLVAHVLRIAMVISTWKNNRGHGVKGSGMDGTIVKALRSQTKTLTLDNCGLEVLPSSIGRLCFLHTLSAKNNLLKSLPVGFIHLTSVSHV